ncbi:MAG TPA: DsbA family protein [Vicinamibacterales bacterium]|nr:DsbA family protein [Vicinamibacterales bacterium]
MSQSPAAQRISEWRSFIRSGALEGAPNARVTLVVFADYQCPFCRDLESKIAKVRASRGSSIAYEYRNFPLAGHPFARAAAIAAECARRQGRFQAFHDSLFAQQDSLGKKPWSKFAEQANVSDLTTFNNCVGDSATAAIVDDDLKAGEKLGVNGTPTFLVNDRLFPGTVPSDELDQLVAKALH